MKVKHVLDGIDIEKRISEDAGFLLTNKTGGYFSQGISSRYSGLFFNMDGMGSIDDTNEKNKKNNDMLKIIDSITLDKPFTSIENHGWCVLMKNRNEQVEFFMPTGSNVLACTCKQESALNISFDVRKPYDMRKFGKDYMIYEEDHNIIIEFIKNKNNNEDAAEGKEYSIFIVITGDELKYRMPDRWLEKAYQFDRERGTKPDTWFVYEGLHILSEHIIIAAASTKETAIKNAQYTKKNLAKLKAKAFKQERPKQIKNMCAKINDKLIGKAKTKARIKKQNRMKADEVGLAYTLAARSLKGLMIESENPGLYAGLPWFFQFWTRDEAISLKALMILEEYDFVNRVLMRELKSVCDNGRIPNRHPSSDIQSADGTGWMFRRIQDFCGLLKDRRLLRRKYFGKFEEGYAKGQIEYSLRLLYQNFTSGDLNKFALNGPQETWMDTVWNGDNRAGSRVEIQALRLSMYNLAYGLSQKSIFKELEDSLKKKVKKHFWNEHTVADGLDDWTIRPNVFLAAYIYPELLSKKEWAACFEKMMPQLWLEWGGVSTIDKSHKLFVDKYTGESNQSYHRGDSWYWVNNIVAIVLARVDKRRFGKYIDAIFEASTNDILWKGYIGHASEISSAKEQEAQGCLCQAWSAAIYVELVHELF